MGNGSTVRGAAAGLAGLSSALLLASLFLDWYELTGQDVGDSITLSGWQGLEFGDASLVLIAAAAAGCLVAKKLELLWMLGVCAIVVVSVILASDTPSISLIEAAGGGPNVSREIGLLVAMVGGVLLAVAGFLVALLDRDQQ